MPTMIDQINADPNKTPYTWEAHTEDGVTIAVESPPGATDDTPFRVIGFMYEARTSGRAPDDVHTFRNTTDRNVVITAKSLRGELCPHMTLTIEPGMLLVWAKRAIMPFQIMGNEHVPPFETMMFGRELVNGQIEIAQIWPNGEYKPYTSYAEAMAAL